MKQTVPAPPHASQSMTVWNQPANQPWMNTQQTGSGVNPFAQPMVNLNSFSII